MADPKDLEARERPKIITKGLKRPASPKPKKAPERAFSLNWLSLKSLNPRMRKEKAPGLARHRGNLLGELPDVPEARPEIPAPIRGSPDVFQACPGAPGLFYGS
jgi:hypothetical protein